MTFTALHRLLGVPAGPITNDMITAAIAAGLSETDDLDWKSELPPAKAITQTDYPKDIAAMANTGGGTIVYGIAETQGIATARSDIGEFDETRERTMRSAAITAVSPPVFGLDIYAVGAPGHRVVAVVVPGTIDAPHLIYRGEYFGAPIRNNADTVWMKERQIETMYRARFDERRHTNEALTNLYAEAAAGRDTGDRAWLIAAAKPRIPAINRTRPTRSDAYALYDTAGRHALTYSPRVGAVHPLETVNRSNPRPGLRRWVAPNTADSPLTRWKEAWASIHHDGAVTLAAAVGGQRSGVKGEYLPGGQIDSSAIEQCVADLFGLIRASSEFWSTAEYETQVAIDWEGPEPLLILTTDTYGTAYAENSLPLPKYTPVTATVVANVSDDDFLRQLVDLAHDCINQGGVAHLRQIREPRDEPVE